MGTQRTEQTHRRRQFTPGKRKSGTKREMLPFAEPDRSCAEHALRRMEQNSTGDMTFEIVQAGCLVGQKKWGSEAECDLENQIWQLAHRWHSNPRGPSKCRSRRDVACGLILGDV